MKSIAFARRNFMEILRDKINLFFGIGFPVVVMLLLWAIQSNIPVKIFPIEALAPGMCVFGLSFISLFSGVLIAKDRSSSFMMRLLTSPMKASDFITGYTMPMLPVSIMQMILCLCFGMVLGLKISPNLLLTIVVLIPAAIMFISIGLLCGSIFTDKQVGGVCGALLTNLCAWMSGIWFDLNLVGGIFKKIADVLPFSHAVNAAKYTVTGEYGLIMPELYWVTSYAVIITAIAIIVFTFKMNSDNK